MYSLLFRLVVRLLVEESVSSLKTSSLSVSLATDVCSCYRAVGLLRWWVDGVYKDPRVLIYLTLSHTEIVCDSTRIIIHIPKLYVIRFSPKLDRSNRNRNGPIDFWFRTIINHIQFRYVIGSGRLGKSHTEIVCDSTRIIIHIPKLYVILQG